MPANAELHQSPWQYRPQECPHRCSHGLLQQASLQADRTQHWLIGADSADLHSSHDSSCQACTPKPACRTPVVPSAWQCSPAHPLPRLLSKQHTRPLQQPAQSVTDPAVQQQQSARPLLGWGPCNGVQTIVCQLGHHSAPAATRTGCFQQLCHGLHPRRCLVLWSMLALAAGNGAAGPMAAAGAG